MIRLIDDGRLDTVLECSECGEEFRYNYVHYLGDEYDNYDRWVDQIIKDETQEHECPNSETPNYPFE